MDEVVVSGKLALQNEDKEELVVQLLHLNKQLAFQNEEKEKRAAELVIANKELVYQNEEKEKRAAELVIANKELVFQNEEKEKRAAELVIANKELLFQNEEKEKRANELIALNKELLTFTYISNHDLQEPLRKIQTFTSVILEKEHKTLTEQGKGYLKKIQFAAERTQLLISDLLLYHDVSTAEYAFETIDLSLIVNEIRKELSPVIAEKNATIECNDLCNVNTTYQSIRQLMYNVIHNALKFSDPAIPLHISIKAEIVQGSELKISDIISDRHYAHIAVQDNGIGFEPEYSKRIFEIFEKLHPKDQYTGTGMGLAMAEKIVKRHNGFIFATSELNKGATFDIYIPNV